jgi:hypothetical protein
MANTYVLIEAKTLSSNTESLTFTSIPQTYTDLIIKVSARSTANRGASGVNIEFNGLGSSNFNGVRAYGTGTSTGSYSSGNFAFAANGAPTTASTFNNGEIYIMNYAGNTNKSFSDDDVTENMHQEGIMTFNAGLWNNTAAITSLTFRTDTVGESLVSGSTFYLYGIKNS